jgi:hypothetical protein
VAVVGEAIAEAETGERPSSIVRATSSSSSASSAFMGSSTPMSMRPWLRQPTPDAPPLDVRVHRRLPGLRRKGGDGAHVRSNLARYLPSAIVMAHAPR